MKAPPLSIVSAVKMKPSSLWEGCLVYSVHLQHFKFKPVSPETSIRPQLGMITFARGGTINSRISLDPC